MSIHDLNGRISYHITVNPDNVSNVKNFLEENKPVGINMKVVSNKSQNIICGYYTNNKINMWWSIGLAEDRSYSDIYITAWGKSGREMMGSKKVDERRANVILKKKLDNGYEFLGSFKGEMPGEPMDFLAELQKL